MKVYNDLSVINVLGGNNQSQTNIFSQISSGKKSLTTDPANVGLSSRTSSDLSSSIMAIKNIDTSLSAAKNADSLLEQTNSSVSRMKELAVKYNSGTLSDADKINTEVEFKSLQRDISRTSSKYTEAARANDLYISDKTAAKTTGNAAIGTINRYTYDENNKVTASSHTDVSWKDITTMSISDSEAAAKLDVATDFNSKATTANAVTQKTLESRKSALITQESNLLDEESTINNVDVASKSTNLVSSLMKRSSGAAISSQSLNLNNFAILSLLRG